MLFFVKTFLLKRPKLCDYAGLYFLVLLYLIPLFYELFLYKNLIVIFHRGRCPHRPTRISKITQFKKDEHSVRPFLFIYRGTRQLPRICLCEHVSRWSERSL